MTTIQVDVLDAARHDVSTGHGRPGKGGFTVGNDTLRCIRN